MEIGSRPILLASSAKSSRDAQSPARYVLTRVYRHNDGAKGICRCIDRAADGDTADNEPRRAADIGKSYCGPCVVFNLENDFRGGHRQAGQLETGSDTECEPEKEEFSNGESG